MLGFQKFLYISTFEHYEGEPILYTVYSANIPSLAMAISALCSVTPALLFNTSPVEMTFM